MQLSSTKKVYVIFIERIRNHCGKIIFFIAISSLVIMPFLMVANLNDKFSLFALSAVLHAVAIPITYAWSYCLHCYVNVIFPQQREENKEKSERIPWIPLTIGIFERTAISVLIGCEVSGSAAFVGAWVTIKAIGGWSNISKDNTYGRAIFFLGLLGSIMSIWFAILAGLVIKRIINP